jgi:hypothetical protein
MWTGFIGYKAERIVPLNLLNGRNGNLGIRCDIIASRYFVFSSNLRKYIIPIDQDLVTDKWYAVVINISNKYRQLSLNIWERKWVEGLLSSPQTTDLQSVYSRTVNQLVVEDRSATATYNLVASNSLITNIRLYDRTIETEKQPLLLNQNIVQDADRCILVDNAIPRNTLPFIAQTK